MSDHSMLMRASAEHDISHVRLAAAVAYLEVNLDEEKAAEAISLIHAAISPAHAVVRQRPVEPVVEDAAEADPEPVEPEVQPVAEAVPDKPAATKKAPGAKKSAAKKPVRAKASK